MNLRTLNKRIVVTMGSISDYKKIENTIIELTNLGYKINVPDDVRVTSAHRTPDLMMDLAHSTENEGIDILIACAGGSAHLPGMLASETSVFTIGIPASDSVYDGTVAMDSNIHMPPGKPLITVGINRGDTAARLADRVIHCYDGIRDAIERGKDITPCVNIVYSRVTINPSDIEKITNTLNIYGIKHKVISLSERNFYAELENSIDDSTFSVISLSGFNLEETLDTIPMASRLPIIAMPLPIITMPRPKVISSDNRRRRNGVETTLSACQLGDQVNHSGLAAVNGWENLALTVVKIAGTHDNDIRLKFKEEQAKLREKTIASQAELNIQVAKTIAETKKLTHKPS